MPPSEIHKQKNKKNWAILLAIACFCALIWIITMVRIAGEANAGEIGIEHAFKKQRSGHVEKLDEKYQLWNEARSRAAKRAPGEKDFQEQRDRHLKSLYE